MNKVRFITQFVTLILISVEAALLEIKYGTFSGGGFLQSSPLVSAFDKTTFIILFVAGFFLLRQLALLSVYKMLPKAISSQFRIFYGNAVFIFIYGIALMANYKLHSYVADHVDHTVINAIAGGSLANALVYVKDELVIFALPILIYILLVWFVSRRMVLDEGYTPSPNLKTLPILLILIFLSSITSGHNVTLNAKRTLAFNMLYQTAHMFTDVDFDGSSYFSVPVDPAPFDAQIHWGATDLPDNGVDENGLGGDLSLTSSTNDDTVESVVLPAGYRHLMILVGESTRADILTTQIGGQYVAPNLRKLVADGSAIERAFSHAGFTANSLYTLFAGRYVPNDNTVSLFQAARQNGFDVNIFSGQDETWGNLDHNLKTKASASFFYDPQEDPEKRVFPSKLPSSIKLTGETLHAEFVKQLPGFDLSKRQMFYFNFQAAHFPYFHDKMPRRFVETGIPRPEITETNKEWLTRTYWNALSYMDQNIGRVIRTLEEHNMLDETLVIFIGDHGESLFHGGFLGHGHDMNRDQLQIPMVFSAPGISFKAPIGLIDLSRWLRAFITTPEKAPVKFEKKGGCVFAYTGFFHVPAQIGRICKGQKEFDVYTIAFDELKTDTGKDPEQVKKTLIHDWEQALYNLSLQ